MHIIAGTHKSRKIFSPKGDKTRPTSSKLREAFFSMCQNQMSGASFLDLFAGSGAMGLEALSRGVESAVFVEQERVSVACIQRNLESLGMDSQGRVYCGDVLRVLKKLSERSRSFNLIYADPPYGKRLGEVFYSTEVLQEIDRSGLLAPKGILFFEEGEEWDPTRVPLKTLILEKSRRFGHSQLYSFVQQG